MSDVCFETVAPPVFEEFAFHERITGDKEKHKKKFKRLGSLDSRHAIVAPYAQQLRLVLYPEHRDRFDPSIFTHNVIEEFVEMCKTANLPSSMIMQFRERYQLEADSCEFFSPKRLHKLAKEFKRLPWPVAFQLESLLHNRLLHAEDLEKLLSRVRTLISRKDPAYVCELLRKYYGELKACPSCDWRESPLDHFTRLERQFKFHPRQPSNDNASKGHFQCCHVTITPTRMILEGPYAVHSNRVIREYSQFEDSFLRVDFRDEDRLQYRWACDVDGTDYLDDRVGGILKNGF